MKGKVFSPRAKQSTFAVFDGNGGAISIYFLGALYVNRRGFWGELKRRDQFQILY